MKKVIGISVGIVDCCENNDEWELYVEFLFGKISMLFALLVSSLVSGSLACAVQVGVIDGTNATWCFTYSGITVSRGKGDSQMITDVIMGEVVTGEYKLSVEPGKWNFIVPNAPSVVQQLQDTPRATPVVTDAVAVVTEVVEAATEAQPVFVTLTGVWGAEHCAAEKDHDPSSILGRIGCFLSPSRTVTIPVMVADRASLEHYGATLLENGDHFRFETPEPMAIWGMRIGRKYLAEYIMAPSGANGAYLEYHNLPHYHQPQDTDAGGHLILGKKVGELEYQLTAFSIPFGKAVYTPPKVVHTDSFLVGNYTVVYGAAKDYSTVRILNAHDLIPVQIGLISAAAAELDPSACNSADLCPASQVVNQ